MPGVYTVTYSVSDALENKSTITRKVTVGDTAAPVITLLGDAEITLEAVLGTQTLEQLLYDTLDGDLTDNIIVVNPEVKYLEPAIYTITYNVKDSSDNTAVRVSHKVTVVDTTAPVIPA